MFDSLRQDNGQVPTLWGQEEFDIIKGASLEGQILSINQAVDNNYEVVSKEIENMEGQFTLREYKEAWTIMDLNFQNMVKSKTETCGFVPFLNYFTNNDDT